MKLLNIQKKFIEFKPVKNLIIKGKANTGKREALLHRILYLINNFAYEPEDKLLVIEKEEKDKKNLESRYKDLKEKNKYNYYSLLSTDKEPIFKSFSELINDNITNQKKISSIEKLDVINSILSKDEYSKTKKFNKDNAYIILNEIKYMKINKVNSLEDYLTLMGAPLKLRKNSKSRSVMFNIFNEYNMQLGNKGLIDHEDLIDLAINNIEKGNNKYVHVLINNAQDYSSLELEYLMKLSKKKSYGTLTLSIDLDKGENIYSELVKKGRVYLKRVFGSNKKVFNFKTDISLSVENKVSNNLKIKDIEEYVFLDLKHNRDLKFSINNNSEKEKLICEDEIIKEEELQEVPVFNNIAAGEPILINPTQEDIFPLPKYWIKSNNQKFILKVKGDSMINANINNGDLVIIEQNPTPSNGDIVAVNIDGNATLKRLKIEKERVLLMPENDKYEPISIYRDDEFFVLGKAIGIITKGGR